MKPEMDLNDLKSETEKNFFRCNPVNMGSLRAQL